MISALVLSDDPAMARQLDIDLSRVGIHVLGATQCDEVVRSALRLAPDVIVGFEAAPDKRLFDTLALLESTAPTPVALFTETVEVEAIERAVSCGVHAYVPNGYQPQRLRPIIHLALARFRREAELRQALVDVTHRFEERKLVDRAKGILMRATQLPEEDAFRILRNASMRGNRRVGQVSRQVIDAARYAESVNRAGQLRMLSQRLMKLHVLLCLGVDPQQTTALMTQSIERADENLDRLRRTLSLGTYGDVLDEVQKLWNDIREQLRVPARVDGLARLDAQADRLLDHAERLTASLEVDGVDAPLHVINQSGRQRMLSQRLAKLALLAPLLPPPAASNARAAMQIATAEFQAHLEYLSNIPLSTPDIRQSLSTASSQWQSMVAGLDQAASVEGRAILAAASEALLQTFEHLTDRYESSMQILTGWRTGSEGGSRVRSPDAAARRTP